MAKLRKVRFILVPVLVELYSSGAAKVENAGPFPELDHNFTAIY
jgi:hypothetical protein